MEKLNGKNDLYKLNGFSAPNPPVNGKVHQFTEEIFLKPSLRIHLSTEHLSRQTTDIYFIKLLKFKRGVIETEVLKSPSSSLSALSSFFSSSVW